MAGLTPESIRAVQHERQLEIGWRDGRQDRLPYRFLRGRCPCAACVNEFTGRRVVDVADVSEQVQPTRLDYAGNYALKIAWNDAHDTGLYTWEYLLQLGREACGSSPASEPS
ncbi:MAG TPA: DUF971 domain-containing protein [Planctomycetaceae bacterium]|nr:DUF971 domain-containing protein [Planctomycetaceae bacterium]